MTVLIYFEELGIAFSDVMMSINQEGVGVSLPSVGHIKLPNQASSLVRKIFTIERPKSKGTFLLCGTKSHIQSTINLIDELISGETSPDPDLERKLNINDVASLVQVAAEMTERSKKCEFELFGIVDKKTFLRHFNTTISQKIPYWGSVLAMGSGAEHIKKCLIETGSRYEKSELMHDDKTIKTQRALHYVPSVLLEEDTREGRTLTQGVGGYYEAFTVGEDNFNPLDKVLTIFGRFRKGNRKRLAFELRRIYFHIYHKNTLVIGSVITLPKIIADEQTLKIPLNEFKIYHINPFGVNEENIYTASKLAIQMNSAESMRLTTYRGKEDASLRRHYEGTNGRRLLNFDVKNDYLWIVLNMKSLEYYLDRSDKEIPLE